MEEETNSYISELVAEKNRLDSSFVQCSLLLAQEIDRVQTGTSKDKMIDVHVDKPTQISTKIRIPCKEYPKVNFVGRILGQKGSNMKRLQDETGTKISIQGRGSMRDPFKEEELRKEGGKYAHLSQDLHVHIETYGYAVECYQKMSLAIFEISKYLSPDYTEEETESFIPANGNERVPVGRGRAGHPPATGLPPVIRGRGPELRPLHPPMPPIRPGHLPPFPPAPGLYPPHLRRPMPPAPVPIRHGPRPVGLRSALPIAPPARPYGIPPRPHIPPPVAGVRPPPPYEYDMYGSREGTVPLTEDFTSDEWAKDITTTDVSFRGKIPTIRPLRGQSAARVGVHPYAVRNAK